MRNPAPRPALIGGLLTAASTLALAGPIDPPQGPVASTYKTLTEVEPRIAINAEHTPGDADSQFRISRPGSYYLTGNVDGLAATTCIEIASPDVTIDLMGFTLRGTPDALFGIAVVGVAADRVTVRNGVVAGFGADGVNLTAGKGRGNLVEGVHAAETSGSGIRASDGAVVRGCTATRNGSHGITLTTSGTIDACAAFDNDGNGIDVGSRCAVTGCASSGSGQSGFLIGPGSLIARCTASANDSSGFAVRAGCTVSDCTAESNALHGVHIFGDASTVRGTTSTSNGAGGDGAGILISTFDNRIEGNCCVGNDRGIHVVDPGNFIARNTCSGNTTNWDIVAGNAVAPIVKATTNGGAIVGDTYGGNLGSTDPNANFTY